MRTRIAVATIQLASALIASAAVAQTEHSVAIQDEGVTVFEWEADARGLHPSMQSWLLSTSMVTGVSTGSEYAPITIVLVDYVPAFELPDYSRFYRETLPKIHARYVETGLARLVAVPYESGGSYGLGLICADRQQLGWEFNETAYSQFGPQFVGLHRVYGDSDLGFLVSIAETAGLDSEQFATCFSSIRGSIGEMGDGSGRLLFTFNPLFREPARALFRTPAYAWRMTVSVGMSSERAFSGVSLDIFTKSDREVLDWLDIQVFRVWSQVRD